MGASSGLGDESRAAAAAAPAVYNCSTVDAHLFGATHPAIRHFPRQLASMERAAVRKDAERYGRCGAVPLMRGRRRARIIPP